MRLRALIFSIILFSIIGQASATIQINGTSYDTTWDGRKIPSSQIEFGTSNDIMLISENATERYITADNITITYSKSNKTTFIRNGKFSISPSLEVNKTLLINNYMVNFNATIAYLRIPFKLSKAPDWFDDHNLRVGKWSFDTKLTVYDDNETVNVMPQWAYDFKIISGEPRLYFSKSEANKMKGNITFEMKTWDFNGSTSPAWSNVSYSNTSYIQYDYNNSIILNNVNNTYTVTYNASVFPNQSSAAWTRIVSGAPVEQIQNGIYNISTYSGQTLYYLRSNIFISGHKGLVYFIRALINDPTTVGMTIMWLEDTRANKKVIIGLKAGQIYDTVHSQTYNLITNDTFHIYSFLYNNETSNISWYVDYIKVKEYTITATASSNRLLFGDVGIGDTGNISIDFVNYRLNSTEIDTKVLNGSVIFQSNLGSENQGQYWNWSGTGNLTGNASNGVNIEANGTNRSANINHSIVAPYAGQYQNITINVTDPNWSMSNLTILDMVASTPANNYIPPTPTNLAQVNGSFWINHTWSPGAGNITDSYNVSLNGVFDNSTYTANHPYLNSTTTPGSWYNITIQAFNNSGTGSLNATAISMNTKIISTIKTIIHRGIIG